MDDEKEYATIIAGLKTQDGLLSGDLLRRAWESCVKAQVFYADIAVREHYLQGDRLKITRLSGEPLSMEQCYINLAIEEKPWEIAARSERGSDEGDTAPQSSPFSLRARLKVETPNKKIQVELPAIFNPRKGRDGNTTQPRRILIRGRAGVGEDYLVQEDCP